MVIESLAFWASYVIFIFFGGALILMILISIIQVEITEWRRKRNKIAMRTHKKRNANAS
jgi:membrane protein YdbS with pleckstrin-like domain